MAVLVILLRVKIGSPSSRRAWIEILVTLSRCIASCVALLAEGVDRNQKFPDADIWVPIVALLAEGVDRNFSSSVSLPLKTGSPSSRRAWIEI